MEKMAAWKGHERYWLKKNMMINKHLKCLWGEKQPGFPYSDLLHEGFLEEEDVFLQALIENMILFLN